MNADIEVEVRGPLTREDFDRLSVFFGREARAADRNRVLIDYSTFLEGGVADRTTDIRLRATNGVPEIIVKLGVWGGADQRRELSVKTAPGTFDTLVEVFGALGFRRGMLCVRNSRVFEYRGAEFALVEVPGHSYYFEAERMAARLDDYEKISSELAVLCAELGLRVFSREEFFAYIERLNNDVNEIFDFDRYEQGYFRRRFSL